MGFVSRTIGSRKFFWRSQIENSKNFIMRLTQADANVSSNGSSIDVKIEEF